MPLVLPSCRPVCYARRKLEDGGHGTGLWAVALVEGVPEQAVFSYAYELESASIVDLPDLVLSRFAEPPSPSVSRDSIRSHLLFFTSAQLQRYGPALRAAWTCRSCGISRDHMTRCGNCSTCYCSSVCQRLHWRQHKAACPLIQATHEAGLRARESCGRCLPRGTRYHGVLSSYDAAMLLHLSSSSQHGAELMSYAEAVSEGVYATRHVNSMGAAVRVPSAVAARVTEVRMRDPRGISLTPSVLNMSLGSVYDDLATNRRFRLALGHNHLRHARPPRGERPHPG